MTVSDSGSNTWTNPVIAAGVTTDGGVSAVYYHYFVTAPGSMTVSVAYAGWGSGGGGRQVAVLVLIGAASNQAAGATAKLLATTGTTGTVSITTTTTGSWVFGASSDVISNDSWTANASTQADNNYSDSTDLVTLVAWDALALTTTPGATTLGGTWGVSTESNQCAFEVLPKTAFIATQPLILTAAAVRKAYY
ncbi:MAG: hypothetical protein ACREQ5_00550 [Candidatus Dormibacteria bacterium]